MELNHNLFHYERNALPIMLQSLIKDLLDNFIYILYLFFFPSFFFLSSKGIEPFTAINQFFYREPPLPFGSPAHKFISGKHLDSNQDLFLKREALKPLEFCLQCLS